MKRRVFWSIKERFRVRFVSEAQAISTILCCPRDASGLLDLLSLGHRVRGHYQGGLEPSWDGSPLLKSISVGVHGVGMCVPHNVHTWFTWSDLGVLGQEP